MIAEQLKNEGFARLPQFDHINEVVKYLNTCQKFPGHVNDRPRPGVYHNAMSDLIQAPYFLDYARSFADCASEYFGSEAILWSLNAFYTSSETPYIPSINGIHKDSEANKILTLFVLGYDTEIDGSQILLSTNGDSFHAFYGKAGTAWLADTSRFHAGFLPKKERLLLWARWASELPNAARGLPKIANI